MRKEKLEELKKLIEGLTTLEKDKIDTTGDFIKSDTYDCYLANGKIIRREQLIKGSIDGSAVIILPVTEEHNILLVVEPRVFTKRTVGVGLPAGYIEPNETKEEAAKRELMEETGYIPENLIELGSFYQDAGCSSAYNTCFLATGCKKIGPTHFDKDEYVETFICTYSETLELIDKGFIEDGNALLTIEKAKVYQKGGRL